METDFDHNEFSEKLILLEAIVSLLMQILKHGISLKSLNLSLKERKALDYLCLEMRGRFRDDKDNMNSDLIDRYQRMDEHRKFITANQ